MAYRILSLDGGGAWALIEVQALIALHGGGTKGHAVLSQYDFVAANSGGSLVLGGLIEDMTLDELRNFFMDEAKRRSIFSPSRSWRDRLLRAVTGLGPKYSAEAKRLAIERLLPRTGGTLMNGIANGIIGAGGAPVHVLIVGFNYDRNLATFFRSAPAGGPAWGDGAPANVSLAHAIHASTNAPVNYFDGPALCPGTHGRYWDGGITGCNNPVLAAVTEAITLGRDPQQLAALSLGTGTVRLPLAQPGQPSSPYLANPSAPGLLPDLRKLATSILDDPPDAATFIAHAMTGGLVGVPIPAQSRIVRMNPMISPVLTAGGTWTAPSGMTEAQFVFLRDLDMDGIEQSAVTAISRLADLWLADKVANQPIRGDGATMQPEIGYGHCSEAMQAWHIVR